MASSLLLSLIIIIITFSLFSLSSSTPSETILDASRILTNSGFTSMARTLELASQSLLHRSSSITIFAPPDFSFSLFRVGIPPLSLLQYHILPHAFSIDSLYSLPPGAKIPTMLPRHFLTVTRSLLDHRISLNNITVGSSPIYDDGYITIFGIPQFFDPHFEISSVLVKRNDSDLQCLGSTQIQIQKDSILFSTLKNRGRSVMASFLDLQFLGFQNPPMLTIFAPTDESLINHIGNFTDWPSIFHRHIVPCKLRWDELTKFSDEMKMKTYLDKFEIDVARIGGVLMLNNMTVTFPDLYYSDWIVVHGIGGIFPKRKEIKETGEFSPESPLTTGPSSEVSHYHFSVFKS